MAALAKVAFSLKYSTLQEDAKLPTLFGGAASMGTNRGGHMSREDTGLERVQALSFDTSNDQTVAILAVGNAEEWRKTGNRLQGEGRIAFVSLEEITDVTLSRLCPTVILSPVLANSFDCIDLAQRLFSLGFTGRYRAVSDELPNPEMVEREIQHLCPGLDFGILVGR